MSVVGAVVLIRLSGQVDRWQTVIGPPDALHPTLALRLRADAPVTGWTRSSAPTLVVACGSDGLPHVSIDMGLPIEVEHRPTRSVSIQFDDDAPVVEHWVPSDDRQTVSAPAPDATRIASRLAGTSRLSVGFVPLGSEVVVARFSLFGFGDRWSRAEGCRAGGRFGDRSSVER